MSENTDKAFAFDPFDNFTIVITTPVGVEVKYAKYSELERLDVPELVPGIAVEVIPPARADGSQPEGVYLTEGQSVKDVADGLTGAENAPDEDEESADEATTTTTPEPARGPRAQASGPVGPDPKQEAARSVAVKSPTGPTGARGKRS